MGEFEGGRRDSDSLKGVRVPYPHVESAVARRFTQQLTRELNVPVRRGFGGQV